MIALLAALFAVHCPFAHSRPVKLRGLAEHVQPWLWVDRLGVSGAKAALEFGNGQGSDYFIYFHSLVLAPNTSAVVTAACPSYAPHILGVRITSGLHKGAFGYVDVRTAEVP